MKVWILTKSHIKRLMRRPGIILTMLILPFCLPVILNFNAISEPDEEEGYHNMMLYILRGSMDEIRQILREEKPKSSQMNELKLRSFCKEFEVQYDIGVHLILEGDLQKIMEPLWKVLFECIFEAFSNALKYAKCNQIEVRLMIFN